MEGNPTVETILIDSSKPTQSEIEEYRHLVSEMKREIRWMDEKYGEKWDNVAKSDYLRLTSLEEKLDKIQAKYPNYDFKNNENRNMKGNGKMENKFKNAKNGEELANVEFEIREHHMGYNPASSGSNFSEAKVVSVQQQVLDLLHKQAVVLEHVQFNAVQGERKLPVAVNNNEKTAIVLENEAFSEKDYGVQFKSLECQKLGQMSVMSTEALQDSVVNIAQLISEQTAKDYARKLEELLLVGAEKGKAEGVLVAEDANVVRVAAFDYEAFVDAFYALPKHARAKAVFLTDNAGLRALRKLKDANQRPLLQQSVDSIGQRGQDFVLGCPVVEVEATNLPSGVYGAFVDFDDAVFAAVGRQFNMVRDDSMKRQYDQVCFVSNMRFGCIVKDAQCISIIKQQ